jgi:ABC-type polysaccharide/polyol phosphate transport system ATPase subunit
MLAGIYVPNSGGKITIDGKLSPFLELGVGFNPELTARENVYLGGSILGLTKKDIDKNLNTIIKFAELEEFVDMKFKNFSSGMQVRLAFSLAIHAHAEILLMDEVLAVGDTNFQSKCLTEFNKYKKKGKTVVLVTHDIGTVERYCDKAILLRSGKIVKMGKAEEVCDEYTYQNMSDEERRLHAEQKMQASASRESAITSNQEEKNKNKRVEITAVKLLDKNEKEKKVFLTGDPLTIKIDYKVKKEINGLNIGIGLYSQDDERVFTYNTQMDRIKIDKDKKSLRLYFDKLPILKGDYYLNVACFGDTEKVYYDIKRQYKELKIFTIGQKNTYRGLCDIEHQWQVN